MKLSNLKVEYVEVSKLKYCEYNARVWSEKATKDLTESIKRFGIVSPLLVNSSIERKNIVLGGNFRLKILNDLGVKETAVIYLDIPDIEKERELNLRLNANTGDFDWEKLKNFDLELLLDVGFDDSGLSKIWDTSLEIEDDDFDPETEAEKVKQPKTKIGDLYKLNDHYLLCGDSQDINVVKRLVGETKIDLITCDPVYNISYDYNKGLGKKNKYSDSVNDTRTIDVYKQFLSSTIANALSVSNQDVHVFYWCDQKYIWLLQTLFLEHDLDNKRVCFWVKGQHNVVPQVAFNKCYEPCVYAVRGSPYLADSITNLNEILNKEIGTGNKAIDDIIDIFDIWLAKRESTSEYQHATTKPITLMEKPLKRCSKVGSTVLDLFGGGGSTLLACEQLKRKAFLCELSPVFCDVIINRWERRTNGKAELVK